MIKVGIIGLGLAARHFHIPLLNAIPSFKITTVLSSKTKTEIQSLVGDVTSVNNIIEFCQSDDFDLAVVLTPNHLHFEQCKALLIAGKHVVVDKPFTVSLKQAKILKSLSVELNLLLSIFQNRRWDSDFLTIKHLNKINTFGGISYFESRFDKYRPEISNKWKESNLSGAGILYDLLPHLSDQSFQLFGYPQFVSATIKTQRENGNVCDYFNVKLIYPNADVVLRASSLAACSPFRFYIEGKKGTYIKKGLDSQELALAQNQFNVIDWITEPIEASGTLYQKNQSKKVTSIQGDYRLFYVNIANTLSGIDDLLVTVDDAIATIKVIELAMQSSELQSVIAW